MRIAHITVFNVFITLCSVCEYISQIEHDISESMEGCLYDQVHADDFVSACQWCQGVQFLRMTVTSVIDLFHNVSCDIIV